MEEEAEVRKKAKHRENKVQEELRWQRIEKVEEKEREQIIGDI